LDKVAENLFRGLIPGLPAQYTLLAELTYIYFSYSRTEHCQSVCKLYHLAYAYHIHVFLVRFEVVIGTVMKMAGGEP
jgi:hypothetical protein